VAECSHPTSEVTAIWTKRYGVPEVERKAVEFQGDEVRRLKAELRGVTEECNILKDPAV